MLPTAVFARVANYRGLALSRLLAGTAAIALVACSDPETSTGQGGSTQPPTNGGAANVGGQGGDGASTSDGGSDPGVCSGSAPNGECGEEEIDSPDPCACADCASTALCNPGQCVADGACTLDDACTCSDCDDDSFCSSNCDLDGTCDSFLEGCACDDCAAEANCLDNPIGSPLGSACDANEDCSTGYCATAGSGAFNGRGPEGGVCTLACTGDAQCAAIEAGAVCNDFGGGDKYCMQSCPRGDQFPKSSKCHGRDDFGCHRPVTGADRCLPTCTSDAGCGGGLFCNLGNGLCQAAAMPPGAATGGDCTGNGSCSSGLCTKPMQAAGISSSGTGAVTCTGFCSLGSATHNCGGPGVGICKNIQEFTSDLGPGDMGLCSALCDCGDQCTSNACKDMPSSLDAVHGADGYCHFISLGGTGFLPDECPCVPDCNGSSADCGPDGCGGSCGTCGVGEPCIAGECCTPDCAGKECGPDGCGGTCGSCAANESCNAAGTCDCLPNACGGSCGGCSGSDVCNGGSCCTPNCAGKVCGTDGCGGSCGTCMPGSVCTAGGFSCCSPSNDCFNDSECCGNICNIITGGCVACLPTGGFCDQDSDCCSNLCDSFGNCTNCLDQFESCSSDAQCCSGYCNGSYCDTCQGLFTSCFIDADCCSNNCGPSDTCQP